MRHRLPKQAIDCPNCRTTHICGIQEDEDGPYVEIETHPCHADGCTTRLCTSCPQAECSECGLSHCEGHIIVAARGPICGVCFQKAIADGVTARTLMTGGCETCNGTGQIEIGGADIESDPAVMVPCKDCGAQRTLPEEGTEDGQDGRDDLDDRDAHQIGSERCPPRE